MDFLFYLNFNNFNKYKKILSTYAHTTRKVTTFKEFKTHITIKKILIIICLTSLDRCDIKNTQIGKMGKKTTYQLTTYRNSCLIGVKRPVYYYTNSITKFKHLLMSVFAVIVSHSRVHSKITKIAK